MQGKDMWYKPENEGSIFTPAILLFPDRIEENIRRMIDLAGDPDRLRPHVKTHKIAELIKMQLRMGITRYKCATLSELKMVAACGCKDALLAYPLLGPDIPYFFKLGDLYPETRLSVTVDSLTSGRLIAGHGQQRKKSVPLFVDLDNGMHRTGIAPDQAMKLIEYIIAEPWLEFAGLHLYDGHIHDSDPEKRKVHCEKDFEAVENLIGNLEEKGIPVGELSCGGTPTFPIHARHSARTLGPGTPILWDAGYRDSLPDLDFLPAAVLAGRVISHPDRQLCLDLGYKSLASEMPHPRLHFLNLDHQGVLIHSEEHLVLASGNGSQVKTGELAYALPTHVCPTMALHEQVYVVRENLVMDLWKVLARKRISKP